MTDTHLRQTERDLFDAAEELRREDLAEIQTARDDLEAKVRAMQADDDEFDPATDVPREMEQRYQRLGQQLRELKGTIETYEHYANAWSGDGESCVFTLEELNGDEYAAVVDAVSAEAGRQRREDGSIPEGFGRIKALEYGVVDKPAAAPAKPGEWPAPIVNELFAALEDITAPSGVDLGNESLASAVSDTTATPTPTVESTASTPTPPDAE